MASGRQSRLEGDNGFALKTQCRNTPPELGVFSLAKRSLSQGVMAVCSKQGAEESCSGSRLATNKVEIVRLSEQWGPGTGFPRE